MQPRDDQRARHHGDDDQAARTFDAAAKLGIRTVIDPFIPSERWQTADDAHRIADRVNDLQAQAAARGLAFGYHNHQWEFANKVDGRPVYELFVERLNAEVVLELDTFWSTVGGMDTPALKYVNSSRIRSRKLLYHLAAIRTLLGYVPRELSIKINDATIQERVVLAVFSNTPTYAGGSPVAPKASIFDAQLDYCVFLDQPRLQRALTFDRFRF